MQLIGKCLAALGSSDVPHVSLMTGFLECRNTKKLCGMTLPIGIREKFQLRSYIDVNDWTAQTLHSLTANKSFAEVVSTSIAEKMNRD